MSDTSTNAAEGGAPAAKRPSDVELLHAIALSLDTRADLEGGEDAEPFRADAAQLRRLALAIPALNQAALRWQWVRSFLTQAATPVDRSVVHYRATLAIDTQFGKPKPEHFDEIIDQQVLQSLAAVRAARTNGGTH